MGNENKHKRKGTVNSLQVFSGVFSGCFLIYCQTPKQCQLSLSVLAISLHAAHARSVVGTSAGTSKRGC